MNGVRGLPPRKEFSIVRRRGGVRSFEVDTGTAELLRDPDRRNAYTLLLDGVESSHVDLDDPRYLAFEYVRWLGDIVDCLAPPGEPLDTLHLGGGAATLARYIAATRPMSRQLVFEIDAALVALVREMLPFPKARRLRVRVADAEAGVAGQRPGSASVVVRDAFRDAVVPEHLRTAEFASLVKQVLRADGVYLLNVADGTPFRHLTFDIAALTGVFAEIAVVSEPAVFRGRRHGNLIVTAANTALPLDAITRAVAAGPAPARVREISGPRARW